MPSAVDSQVLGLVSATFRERFDVIKLKLIVRTAPFARLVILERASLGLIFVENLSLHAARDMPRSLFH